MRRGMLAVLVLTVAAALCFAACGSKKSSSSGHGPYVDDDDNDAGGFVVVSVSAAIEASGGGRFLDDDISPVDDDTAVDDDTVVDDDASPQGWEAWIARLDAPMGQLTVLSKVAGHNAINPVVSPDGQTVVFSANYAKPNPSFSDPPGGNLYKVSAAGGQAARVTSEDWMEIYEAEPAFKPDGAQIAYVRVDSYGELQGLGKIYLTDLNGTSVEPAFPDDAQNNSFDPVYSPDGAKLAYVTDAYTTDGDATEIMLADLASGDTVRLTTTTGSADNSNARPFFEATGQWIFYEGTRVIDGAWTYGLFKVPVDGGAQTKVMDIPSVDLSWVSGMAEYFDFRAASDNVHAACAGVIGNTYGIELFDSFAGTLSPTPATNLPAYSLDYPYWWIPAADDDDDASPAS